MANINKELNDIKNAVYGREVRGSIHDGIKKINEEVENTTDRQDSVEAQFQSVLDETTGKDVISAPEINAAKVGADNTNYPNLKERLDTEHNQLSLRLAQTEQEVEKKIDKVDAATKEQLQQGLNTKITKGTVTRQDLDTSSDSHKWDLNDFNEQSRQAILEANNIDINYVLGEDAVTTENLANGSATFDKRSRLGEIALVTLGERVARTPPNIDHERRVIEFPGNIFVTVGDKRYTVQGPFEIDYSNPNYSNPIIMFDTETEEFNSYAQVNIIYAKESEVLFAHIMQNDDKEIENVFITCPYTINGEDPVIYNLKKQDYKPIEIGSGLAVVYIGAGVDNPPPDVDTKARTLTFSGTFFILYGTKRYSIPGGMVLDYSHITGSAIAFHYDTANGEFYINDTRYLDDLPHTAILIAVIHQDNRATPNFKGIYISCPYTVDGKPPYAPEDGEEPEDKPYVFVQEPIIGDYKAPELPACDGTDPNGFHHKTVMHTDIYGAYDDLVAQYPDYIKKNELGLDSSGTLPIYFYDFNPPLVNADAPKPLPKIIVGTGAHGDGWTFPDIGDGSSGDPPTSVFSMFYFMKDVVERWQENPLLEYIRWNVRIIVVPLMNPWGFDNRSRYNANGVDLNRNYDLGWQEEDSQHKGVAPFSEKETQYIRDLILTHSDAIHFFDYHTISTNARQDKDLQDIRTNGGGPGVYIANTSIGKVSRLWKKENRALDSSLDFYGRATIATGEQQARPIAKNWAEYVAGVFSTTMESFPATNNYSLNSSEIIEMNVEFIGNWIINVLRYYQKN